MAVSQGSDMSCSPSALMTQMGTNTPCSTDSAVGEPLPVPRMSLLCRIACDRAEERRTTLRRLLKERQVPNEKVLQVFSQGNIEEDALMGEDILSAHRDITDRYLPAIAGVISEDPSISAARGGAGSEQATRPSLWYIQLVETVVRFSSFLSECDERQMGADLEGVEFEKMALATTMGLSKATCMLLENGNTVSQKESQLSQDEEAENSGVGTLMETDAASGFDPRLVGIYAFVWLIRLDRYSRARPSSLVPLWKGVCNIGASLRSLPWMPMKLALYSLLIYLQEGAEQVMKNTSRVIETSEEPIPLESQAAQAKLIAFLCIRATSLLKIPMSDDEGCEKLLDPAGPGCRLLSVLVRLRGLIVSSEIILWETNKSLNHRFVRGCESVVQKIRRGLMEMVISAQDEDKSLLNMLLLKGLMRRTRSKKSDDTIFWRLCRLSSDIGKALLVAEMISLLAKNLPQVGVTGTDAEDILVLVKSYLFSVAPMCQPSLVLASASFARGEGAGVLPQFASDTLSHTPNAIASLLLLIGKTKRESKNDFAKFLRLLLRWLAPVQGAFHHPLTQTMAQEVLCLYSIGEYRSLGDNGISADSFPSLLVKVFLDGRATDEFRRGTAGLLIRLLSLPSSAFQLKRDLSLLLAVGVSRALGLAQKASKKRRRGANKTANANPFSAHGMEMIQSVLSHVSPETFSQVTTNDTRVPLVGNFEGRLDLVRPQPGRLVPLLASASTVLPPTIGSFQSVSGISLDEFISRLLVSTKRKLSGRNASKRIGSRRHSLALVAAIDFLAAACRHQPDVFRADSAHVSSIFQLVEMCTAESLLSTQNESDRYPGASSVILSIISLVGALGGCIPKDMSKGLLKPVVSSIHRCLSSSNWTIFVHALTSVHKFSSSIGPKHASVIVNCIPKERASLFTSRVKSVSRSHQISFSFANESRTSLALEKLACIGDNAFSAFPVSLLQVIPEQCYAVQKSLGDGSNGTAFVIFPPGSQSLSVIEDMEGSTDDVCVVQNVRILASGRAVFSMKPLDKP